MTYYQEPLANTPVVSFNGQDFYSLRDRCLRSGRLFEDDMFPISPSSIGLQLYQKKGFSTLEWKRPQDLSNGTPYFILEGVSRFDIQQGLAGDCWFLAALGALTQSPQHLQKILMDQSFSHQYAGIFRFRFWQCGQWVEVVVDDRLPIVDRNYLFVHPRSDNQEFWPCLLEKAYAKFRGSYANLNYGYIADALVDLTGGVVTSFDLHSSPADLVTMVKRAAKAGSLITCTTPAGPSGKATELANGLVSQHAYTVTGAEQIRYRRGWEDLIRLWNPWGKTEWKGRWRDGYGFWKPLCSAQRTHVQRWMETQDQSKNWLHDNKEDGEFWMSCQDFQENFSCLFVCNQVPISLSHGNKVCERWSQMAFKDCVIPGYSAEGLPKYSQYIFSVPDNTRGNNVVVSFTIMPEDFKVEQEKFPLSFEVFKFQHLQEKLPSTFFSQFRSSVKGTVSRTKCNLTKCYTLTSGTYVVAASARKEAIEFLGRVFLKMPDCDSIPEDDWEQSIFHRYAQQGVDIDATRLQRLLNHELLRGHPEDTFSLDQCRGMVALMDLKVDGRLDEKEFSRLWSRLVHCQSVFQNIQRYSGIFLSSDLYQALQDTEFLAGVSITNDLLDLMTLRYSDSSGKVTFPNLACFLVRLEAMSSKCLRRDTLKTITEQVSGVKRRRESKASIMRWSPGALAQGTEPVLDIPSSARFLITLLSASFRNEVNIKLCVPTPGSSDSLNLLFSQAGNEAFQNLTKDGKGIYLTEIELNKAEDYGGSHKSRRELKNTC
ncbi:Calpain-13 [Galemys pyrenaicus]|uniref:Calpain-13 n=1 Tax=Galemys pyrenaicus TaxID=202257 RepID=A0A8J6DJ14_GALPY|nr:Calpain-13 [Galemys pyrenaicus]